MAERKHKVGDVYLLPSRLEDFKRNPIIDIHSRLTPFFGKLVKIASVTSYIDERLPLGYYCILEETTCAVDPDWLIEPSPELIEKYKKEAEEEAERKRKEKEELIKQYRVKREEVVAIAESIFGADRVDSKNVTGGGAFEIILHFPEIVIENTVEATRQLKDIFTKISVTDIRLDREDGNNKISVGFTGTRTSLSLEEYETSYFHSHLGSGARQGWGNFCMGDTYFKSAYYNLMLYPTDDNWEMFFRSIEPYLSWESLEGGPYIKLEQIRSRERLVSSVELDQEAKSLFPSFPKDLWEFREGDIKLIDGHPSIFEYFNERSDIRTLKSSVTAKQQRRNITNYKKQWLVERGGEEFTFKGQKIPLTIYVEEKQTKTETGAETTRKRIEANVVEALTSRIKSETQNFTKRYAYELAKQSNNTTIRPFGAIQSSDSSNNGSTEASV